MRPQLSMAPIGFAALFVLAGCFGTEGGNPHGDRDLGPVVDMSTASDAFSPGLDGSASCDVDGGPASPRCGGGVVGPAECPCTVGEPVVFAENARGLGHRTTLLGPTTAGGFVALHTRTCTEDCHVTRRWTLEVHRFDEDGAPIGEPVEVTRSSPWIDQGALLVDDSLVLVFADERVGPSGISDLYFARLDLATGGWAVAPRLLISASLPILRVWLAPTSGGFGLLYSFSVESFEAGRRPGAHLVRLDEGGAVAMEPVRVVDHPNEAAGFAASGDGFLLGRWTTGTLDFVPLSIDGATTGPATTWSSNIRGNRDLSITPSGAGHRIVWSDALGLHTSTADATGAPTGAVTTLGLGIARDVVVRADGTAAVLWSPRAPCDLAPGAEPWILTRIDASGARLQPDLVVHQSSSSSSGGELVDTARGLVASYVTTQPASRAYWVDVCLP